MDTVRPSRTRARPLALLAGALLILLAGSTAARAGFWRNLAAPAMITAWSYQGYLQDNSDPANGLFDFEFRLFDAPAGGSQLGATVALDDIAVIDGLFTVTLDFGVIVDGTRYLEIGVRYGADSGPYTLLDPRQPLMAVPLAANADLLDGQDASAFARTSALLVTATAGSGGGVVTSTPAGITCGAICIASYEPGTMVTLEAAADSTSSFAGWTGACSGTGSCTVSMNGIQSATATFTRQQAELSVSRTGGGVVTSEPAGIYCGAQCSRSFDLGSAVTLTASPDPTAQFAGWTGACSGASTTCVVTVDAAQSVSARFTARLAVSKNGSGAGFVDSSPPGISCGSTCATDFEGDLNVTLTAAPDSTSSFAGWTGACSGSDAACVVRMSEARSATATFQRIMLPLSVNKTGSGAGSVISSPAGINCGSTCSASYIKDTTVQLTAAGDSTSTFAGWSGSCTGTGSCTVTMDAARTVTATFTRQSNTLTVAKGGDGGGTVVSDPAGIFCGPQCSASLAANTTVTLIAAADSNSSFAGWSGACSGTTTSCAVAMNQARSVTATFTRNLFALTAVRQGAGSGTVVSNPGGIECGATCQATYPAGTVVALTALPAATSNFTGWSGACSGAGVCLVTMTQAWTATATFALNTYQLAVLKSGTGSGLVTSSDFMVNCGATCTATYQAGATVTLTATAGGGSAFAGWSGACAGASTCVVTMDQARSVTAVFNLATSSGG